MPTPTPAPSPSSSSLGDGSGDGSTGGASGKYFKVNSGGANAIATGIDAIAIGQNAQAGGQDAIAVGRNAVAPNYGAIAIGKNAVIADSAGIDQIAIGDNAQAGTQGWTGATSLGGSATSTYDGVAVGYATVANGTNTAALGSRATANNTGAIALGSNASASATYSVALGANSLADRASTVSVGAVGGERQIVNVANGTQGTDAVNLRQLQAVGANVDSNGNVSNSFVAYDDTSQGSITLKGAGGTKIMGLSAGTLSSTSTDAVNGSQLYSTNQNVANISSVVSNLAAGGASSKYVAVNSIGASAAATGTDAIAIGNNAASTGAGSVAVGSGANAGGSSGIALGYGANAAAAGTAAVGLGAIAKGQFSDAIGLWSTATGDQSVALGGGAVADRDNTVSVGSANLQRQITNVANGTQGTDAVNLNQLRAIGANVDSNGNVTGSFVAYDNAAQGSITLKGASGTKITGLSAGTLSSTSTDAVNGSQLYSTNQNVTNVSGGLVNVTSNLANVTNNLANVTNTVNTIVSAGVSAPNAVAYDTSAHTMVTLGGAGSTTPVTLTNLAKGALSARSSDAVNGAQLFNTNQNVTNVTNTVNTLLSTGVSSPNAVVYDTSAHNKLSLGGAGTSAPVTLTNVGAGSVASGSADAINGAQLYNSANSVAAALGAGATVNKDGTISTPSFVIGGNTYADMGDALAAVDSATSSVTTTAKYVKVASSSNAAIATGLEAIAIGGNASAIANNAMAIGAGARSQFANATAIGANSVTYAANTVSVGSRSTQNRITNMANGIDSTDAVTMAQLSALQTQLSQSVQAPQSGGLKSMLVGASVPVTNYIAVSPNVVQGMATGTTTAQNAMAIGPAAQANGIDSLAIGAGTGAGSDGSTAVGSGAAALALNTTVIGTNASTG
ncbi:MAG TPA: hemagglutinin, partial [Paraburkholderia sp.]|nr:hemagglutinin [Paraburkholderia sp.]